MPRTKFSTSDLDQLGHQLDRWRQAQSGASRLPEALWRSAAILATTQGVGHVARTLRLDYSKLKRQVPQAPGRSAPGSPPAFVELAVQEPLLRASALCRIELSDPAGSKMTLDLPCDAPTLVGLAQAFWRRG